MNPLSPRAITWAIVLAAIGAIAYLFGLLFLAACTPALPPEPACTMTVSSTLDAGR